MTDQEILKDLYAAKRSNCFFYVFVVILFTLLFSDQEDCMPTLNLTVYNLILLITLPEFAT